MATLEPLTGAFFASIEEKSSGAPERQRQDIEVLFKRMRDKYQGLAAIKFCSFADPRKAQADGLAKAEEIVSILRFFAPAASDAAQVGIVGLAGALAVPTNSTISLFEEGFSWSEGVVNKNSGSWTLSAKQAKTVSKGLHAALIAANERDEKAFSACVAASIKAFGNASTISIAKNRMDASLNALESVLARHEAEQAGLKVPRRIGLLLGQNLESQQQIEAFVRKAYAYRRSGFTDRIESHRQFMQKFVKLAYQTLLVALANVENFSSRTAFIDAVEAKR